MNRKSVGGTVTGLVGCLVFCIWLLWGRGLPPIWLGLAGAIVLSNTVVELFAPRGTDDFFMATTNAVVCLVFGVAVLG